MSIFLHITGMKPTKPPDPKMILMRSNLSFSSLDILYITLYHKAKWEKTQTDIQSANKNDLDRAPQINTISRLIMPFYLDSATICISPVNLWWNSCCSFLCWSNKRIKQRCLWVWRACWPTKLQVWGVIWTNPCHGTYCSRKTTISFAFYFSASRERYHLWSNGTSKIKDLYVPKKEKNNENSRWQIIHLPA